MKRVSLNLDEYTIDKLKEYAFKLDGSENISMAIRHIVRNLEEQDEQKSA